MPSSTLIYLAAGLSLMLACSAEQTDKTSSEAPPDGDPAETESDTPNPSPNAEPADGVEENPPGSEEQQTPEAMTPPAEPGGAGTPGDPPGDSPPQPQPQPQPQGGAAPQPQAQGGATPEPQPETGGRGGAAPVPQASGGSAGQASPPETGQSAQCSRAATACNTPEIRVSEVDLGVQLRGYGREGDTEPLPLALAARPDGGTLVAALGTDGNVHIAQLDCEDQLEGSPFSFPADNLQDIYADQDGGVVLLTRPATNPGTDSCGGGQLCAGNSSPCQSMWMVRFDTQGKVVWETQVTNLSDDLAGYDDGARFVWWYQHHGRLAYDGSNFAAYFCIGITVNNNACVDIHQGDRMQVVDANGSLVSNHPDSFEVGCSHSWQTRIVWDPRTKHFVMVCTTDNACRIAQPNPYRTVADGDCDGSLFGGDLVLSSTPGYWTAWSQGGQIRLDHFTTGQADLSIPNAGPSMHPHLVSFGTENMLLAWESGRMLTAQIRSAATGEALFDEFPIDVEDHDFQAFKAFPEGSVAYPARGSSPSSVKIARVMACQ